MRAIILFTVLVCAAFGMTGCPRPDIQTLEHDGVLREYIVYVPNGAKGTAGAPLVLALHGGNGSARELMRGFDFRPLADANGFILVYPQGVDKQWNDGRDYESRNGGPSTADDVGFLDALIDRMIAQYDVDANRVFMTGVSNGAMMTYRFACERGERLAAAAPIIGNLPAVLVSTCQPQAPVPLCIINGTDDPLVPFDGGPVNVLGQERGLVLSTAESAAHFGELNGCDGPAVSTPLPDTDPNDGSVIVRWDYPCADAPVVVYQVTGGGHTWPGGPQYLPAFLIGSVNRDADGRELVWSFFAGLPSS